MTTQATHECKLTFQNLGNDQTAEKMVVMVCTANYWGENLFDWAAYIGVVGMEREATPEEIEEIAVHGCKQLYAVAQAVFPHMPAEKYRA